MSSAALPIALAIGVVMVVPGEGAQAAPTAISACQKISHLGSYVLANNLVASGDCLVITFGVNFVTIDLAGFSINGNGSGRGITTLQSPAQGIVVRNGSISNFEFGVELGGTRSTVEGLAVFGNKQTGIAASNVRGSTAIGNTGTGILVTGGVGTGNFAAFNGNGIAGGGTLSGNTASDNSRGIVVFNPGGSTLIGNTADDNGTGLDVVCPSNLTDNTAVRNAKNLVTHGTACHIEDNVAP